MDIEIFNENFQNRDINIRPYLIVVSIFTTILLIIVFLNNNLEDYYICSGKVIDDNISLIVNSEKLKEVTENEKIIIEKNIFTYNVTKIEELDNESLLYEVILEFDRIPKHIFINNNVIEMKIIVNKMTIFDYLIKTVKGEWHIKEISKEELQNINGGGLSLLGAAGIVAGAVFLIGVIDGVIALKE